MGSEVIRSLVNLGRLDRILILDIDPSINEEEILNALRAVTPKKSQGMVKLSGLWQTTLGHAKALASVSRGVFSAKKRIKISFFLCRVLLNTPPP